MLRDYIWNWYRSDLTTRLKPGGRIALIMTRWHEDDLGGRLLASRTGGMARAAPARAWPKKMIRLAAFPAPRYGPNGRMWPRSVGSAAP